jgi:NAD(P)-dependent dehydrogenase (short-subunit alcohol dehydrogenase family)
MARKGITCNAVTPGVIATDMTEDVAEAMLAAVPAGRVGTAQEVAHAVAFLVSAEAAYVNGTTLTVDGAMSA